MVFGLGFGWECVDLFLVIPMGIMVLVLFQMSCLKMLVGGNHGNTIRGFRDEIK